MKKFTRSIIIIFVVPFSSSLFLLLSCVFPLTQGFIPPTGRIVTTKTGGSKTKFSQIMMIDANWKVGPELSRRETWEKIAATGLLIPGVANAVDIGDDNIAMVQQSQQQKLTKTTTATTLGKVPTIRLGGAKSTLEVSRTIQGYWQLAGGHGRYKEADAIHNMQAHFDAGITTLDTADIYGPSELIMGKFLKSQPKAIPCTKFCCFRFLEDITREEVRQRVQKVSSREICKTTPPVKRYVDVALWLTELKEEGLIQEIGATNFDLKRLKELKNAGVPLVSHQVQLSALDRRPVQSGMADWCAENDISLIAFGTVGSGILSNRYLGKAAAPSLEELTTASLRMYSKTANRFGDWKLVQELLQTLNAIATDVRTSGRCPQATIANIAQRFVLQTPAVASVLIGVRNQDHVMENLRSHEFTLNSDEIDAIEKVVAKRSGPAGDVWDIERGIIVDQN